MSFGAEAFAIIKKLFIVSEELTRLATEVRTNSNTVNNHEVRLAVIENTLTIARAQSRLILPGS